MSEFERQIAIIKDSVYRIEAQLAVVTERLGVGPGKSNVCIAHTQEIAAIKSSLNKYLGGILVLQFLIPVVVALAVKFWK